MKIPADLQAFWQGFVAASAVDPTPRFLEACHFDDNQPSADELAELVWSGRKRATAGLLWSFENSQAPVPPIGAFSIVTDFAGTPFCVIETTGIDIVPFNEVTEEFAATEGEGDGSLAYWRRAHEAYFGRECQRIGRSPSPRMPIVCERFEVVYRVVDRSTDPSRSLLSSEPSPCATSST